MRIENRREVLIIASVIFVVAAVVGHVQQNNFSYVVVVYVRRSWRKVCGSM